MKRWSHHIHIRLLPSSVTLYIPDIKTRTPCGYSGGAMPNIYVNSRQARYENIFSLTVDVFAKNLVTWIYEFI